MDAIIPINLKIYQNYFRTEERFILMQGKFSRLLHCELFIQQLILEGSVFRSDEKTVSVFSCLRQLVDYGVVF